mgnify:CR=1 FL=1
MKKIYSLTVAAAIGIIFSGCHAHNNGYYGNSNYGHGYTESVTVVQPATRVIVEQPATRVIVNQQPRTRVLRTSRYGTHY